MIKKNNQLLVNQASGLLTYYLIQSVTLRTYPSNALYGGDHLLTG